MGRYSTDSESSRSSRYKKSKKSSRRSSSRSTSPKKCKKKLKKYKRSNRSSSRDPKTRHNSDSKSYRHRSRSASDRHRRRSSSRDSERRRKDDHRKSKHSRSKKRHRSSSTSRSSSSSSSSKNQSPSPRRKFEYDPDELLEKLNKAAVEAMAANKKIKSDSLPSIEMQIKRQDIINELRASGSTSIIPQSSGISAPLLVTPCPPAAPLLTTKCTDTALLEETPVILDVNEIGTGFTPSLSIETSNNSFLHPNFLLENQEDKLNRWVKKLYQIRQRAVSGEMISV